MKEVTEKFNNASTAKEPGFAEVGVTLEKISSNGVNMEPMPKEKMEQLIQQMYEGNLIPAILDPNHQAIITINIHD